MDISNYSTTTHSEFHMMKMDFIDKLNIFPIAADIGYGGIKVFSFNGKHIFPSIPLEVSKDSVAFPGESMIKYIDENEDVWYVGERARESVESSTMVDNIVYSKERIEAKEYTVLLRVAIYLGLLKPDYTVESNKRIYVSTGLPNDYLEKDAGILKNKFGTQHSFKIQYGHHPLTHVSFSIAKDDIEVLSQPFGTLYAMASDRYGQVTKEGYKILRKKTLIIDGGFHSFDTYLSKFGDKGISKTWSAEAMYNVYLDTINDIQEETKGRRLLTIPQLDLFISRGETKVKYGEDNQVYDFSSNFMKALERNVAKLYGKLTSSYGYFNDIETAIVTGGTGAAFFPYLEKLIKTDVILAEKKTKGDPIDTFNSVFANVQGFFKVLLRVIILENNLEEIVEKLVKGTEAENMPAIDESKAIIASEEDK